MAELAVGRIRRSDDEVRQVLDDLDQQATPGCTGKGRESDRFSYRAANIAVEFMHAGQRSESVQVISRNISRLGVGFLMGKYVHPGTPCRVHLATLHCHNRVHPIDGTVARCRYLPGSGSLYEVGVRLAAPLDVSVFHRGATRMPVLVADASPTLHTLVTRLLTALNAELTSAYSGNQALEAALTKQFAFLLINRDLPELDGLGVVRKLREQGYLGNIVGTADMPPEASQADVERACLEAGCDAFVRKPFPPDWLAQHAAGLVDEPLVSTLAGRPGDAAAVDQFVATLSGHITSIESAFAKNDRAQLTVTARTLYGEAEGFGFARIGEAALAVVNAVQSNADTQAMRKTLQALVRHCRCARPSTVLSEAG